MTNLSALRLACLRFPFMIGCVRRVLNGRTDKTRYHRQLDVVKMYYEEVCAEYRRIVKADKCAAERAAK